MEQVTETKQEQVEQKTQIIDSLIAKLDNNNYKIHFFVPTVNSPSGGMGVLLKMAHDLKNFGLDVEIWYQPRFDQQASFQESTKQKKRIDLFDDFNPSWLDFDISNIKKNAVGDQKVLFKNGTEVDAGPIKLAPEDIIIIPEGFPNIMQAVQKVVCKKIVLAQSWLYVLSGLQVGETWQSLGIYDVISVSDAITEYLNTVMPGLRIKELKQGINRQIFKVPEKRSHKKPLIGYMSGRDQMSTMKIMNMIKMFYAVNPHLRWIKFVELNNLSKDEFAERLKECAFALYTDDIAGFGTLPLEAMACGTHVVGWASYGGKEYINNENGFWAMNGDTFQVVELLTVAVEKWVTGEIDDQASSIQEKYEETLKNYTYENQSNQIIQIIEQTKIERINELNHAKNQ